jgi:uncharacterized protein DUF4381
MPDDLPLRDIHLPEAIGSWPPAMGWWMLLILITLSLYFCWLLYKKLTRQTAVKKANKLLAAIKLDQQTNDLQKLQHLSQLLRRVAISVAPRQQSAGLTGAAWLEFLDSSIKGSPFSQGIGRCLADAHYRQSLPDDIDLAALISLSEAWLKEQK